MVFVVKSSNDTTTTVAICALMLPIVSMDGASIALIVAICRSSIDRQDLGKVVSH
jgi:hypothetical protein